MCPGFVQVDNRLAMGASDIPYSEYGGEQHSINFFVWKVVQYFNLITLSNTSYFWKLIYDQSYENFYSQEKIHSN